jgi:hypothetical protein
MPPRASGIEGTAFSTLLESVWSRADCGTKTFQIKHLGLLQLSANGFLIGMP